MALFKRRSKGATAALSTTLPGLSGEARRFFQALVRHHQRTLDLLTLQGAEPAATWNQVSTVAIAHDNQVKLALRDVGSRVNLLAPEVQRAIAAALEQFAGRLGVRGTLVQAWGTAKALNERFEASWQPGGKRFWWQEMPVGFACILHPAAEGQPVVDGILIFDHQRFEFTPAVDTEPQSSWTKSKVRKTEKVDPTTAVLHLDPATGWGRADIASRTILPDGFFAA
ncbi:hypothetical protein [Streptomyces sp. NPDC005408]|uniref:hypothetical protein n=1 Tax=Streptomyces sp. NPDC005408 TaxID=3155341 RepID=UPI0033B69AA7